MAGEEVLFMGAPLRQASKGRSTDAEACAVLMEQAIELGAATVVLVVDPEAVRKDAGFRNTCTSHLTFCTWPNEIFLMPCF